MFQDESLFDNVTTSFSIRYPSPEILEISGHSPDGTTFVRTYTAGKGYVYGENRLTINLGTQPMGGVGVLPPVPIWAAGAVSGKLELSLATDGSLIGKVIEKGGALLWLVIPVGAEANIWCRCEKVADLPNSMLQRDAPPKSQLRASELVR